MDMQRVAKWSSLVLGLASTLSAGAGVQVVFSSVPGAPTAAVPPGPGLSEPAQFRSFSRPFRSPDGTKWMMQASTVLRSRQNRVLIVFNGTSASTVLREGQPAPWASAGQTVGFFETRMAINDAGQFVFANRTNGGPAATDLSLVKFDGANYVVEIQEGQNLPGGGTLSFAPSSMGITNDGRVAYLAHAFPGLTRCVLGGAVVAQVNVTVPGNQANGEAQPLIDISAGTFTVSPQGDTLYRAVLDGPNLGKTVVVRNGACVVKFDDVIPPLTGPVNGLYYGLEAGAGHWFSKGSAMTSPNPSELFAMRDGAIIARTGLPIAGGHLEKWALSAFFITQGNPNGDWIVGAWCDNPDHLYAKVIVLNGSRVLLRSGQAIDVNDNGVNDDNAFISTFQTDNAFLTNDAAYVNVNLRNAIYEQIGQAFLRVPLDPEDGCPADTNGDHAVNVADLLAVIGAWGPCGNCGTCAGDVAPPGGDCLVNVADLLRIIGHWGACTL